MTNAHDFTVDCQTNPSSAELAGVMRLESVEAYDRVLQPIRAALSGSPNGYTIDVRKLIFLNSSGIRALADVVLLARKSRTPLVLRGTQAIPWQKKTFASLKNAYDSLEVRLE